MATMTVQTIAEGGLNPAYSAVAATDDFDNALGDVLLHVKNNNAGACVVTINPVAGASRPIPGLGAMTKAAAGASIPAGQERIFGPFPPGAFNNASGRVTAGYGVTASVTAAAFRLAQP